MTPARVGAAPRTVRSSVLSRSHAVQDWRVCSTLSASPHVQCSHTRLVTLPIRKRNVPKQPWPDRICVRWKVRFPCALSIHGPNEGVSADLVLRPYSLKSATCLRHCFLILDFFSFLSLFLAARFHSPVERSSRDLLKILFCMMATKEKGGTLASKMQHRMPPFCIRI